MAEQNGANDIQGDRVISSEAKPPHPKEDAPQKKVTRRRRTSSRRSPKEAITTEANEQKKGEEAAALLHDEIILTKSLNASDDLLSSQHSDMTQTTSGRKSRRRQTRSHLANLNNKKSAAFSIDGVSEQQVISSVDPVAAIVSEVTVPEVVQEERVGAEVQRVKTRRRRSRRRSRRNRTDQPATVAEGISASELLQKIENEEQRESPDVDNLEQSQQGESSRRKRSRNEKRKFDSRSEIEPQSEQKQTDRCRRILMNARYADEKRVAIVEGDKLVDFMVEIASREQLKGNIYKGIVTTVMPGLQAAFVDFGQKKHGFLKFREVMPEPGHEPPKKGHPELVKGQELLVQVIKDERDTKGASLTTYISIPGRYIVMMPGQKRIGISRKIESRQDRDRLKEIFNSLKLPKDTGFILRTACGDSIEEELSRDLKYLVKLWERIKADAKKAKAPALIYKEQDITMRAVRDYLTSDVEEVLVDDAKTCSAIRAFLRRIMPWRKVNLSLYNEKEPLFAHAKIEAQIAQLSHRIVKLPSRGYLVFDKTEAMTVIDVNSGRSRKEDIETTAVATNLEAVTEIARQLRLRDIGGLVAIDFIDMESAKNRKLVEMRLQEALSNDKANTELAPLSRFCILELTRERIRPAYAEAISRQCPLCEGVGTVYSDEFVAIAATREFHAIAASGEVLSITCRLPVQSANLLINTRRRELVTLEQEYNIAISIVADDSVPLGQYAIEVQKNTDGKSDRKSGVE